MGVDLARKNLLHDKLRFLITVSGVAFAVTLVFVAPGATATPPPPAGRPPLPRSAVCRP